MRRWVPFGLLLVALAVLAWRWSGADRAPFAEPGSGASAPGEVHEGAALAADPRGADVAARRAATRPQVTGQVLEGDRPVRARVELFPVAGGIDEARVDAHWIRWPLPAEGLPRAVAVVDADDEGRFVFHDVAVARFIVVAQASSGARGWSFADTRPAPRGGVGARVVVRVRGGREVLRGRVRTADGAAWHGAVGVAHGGPGSWPPEAFLLQPTDAEGRFQRRDLPEGWAVVVLFEAGRVRYDGRPVRLPYTGELEIVLPASGAAVRCVVRDAGTGKPIPGAEVGCGMESALGAVSDVWWTAVTDIAGEARLPLGSGALLVEAVGYEPTRVFTEDRLPVVEVRLRALGAVDVLVVDVETKAPVEGALVVGFERAALVPRRAQRTDGEGRCRLTGLAQGETMVVVRGGGWCSVEIARSGAEAGAPWPDSLRCEVRDPSVPALTREAVRLGIVSGRVLDAEGRPVAEADVTALARADSAYTLAGGDEPALMTGRDGTFEGAVLVPRVEYDLEVRAAGQVPTLAGPVRSAAGERVVREVRLEGGRFVNAHVVDVASKAAIPGARLTASVDLGSRPDRPGSRWCSLSGMTDAAGAVRVGPLPRLTTQFGVDAAGWVGGRHIEPVAGDVPGDIELKVALTRQDLRIVGRVRFEDGTSPRDVRVALAEAVPGYVWRLDEQGHFLVEGLTPGDHLLRFSHGDVEEILLERSASAGDVAVDVVLPAPGHRGLSFRVLGADGSAIGGCTYVFGVADGTQWGRAERGFVRLRPFAGALWILFSGAQDEQGRPLECSPTPAGPFSDDGRTIEVRMRPGRSADGEVVGEDGRGLAGVTVRAWALAPPTSSDPTMGELAPEQPVAVTDASGRFVLHGLDATPYRVSVDAPKGFATAASVDVRGGDTGVQLVLPRPTDVVVAVVDPSGRPIAGAVVERRFVAPDLDPIPPTDAAGRTTIAAASPAVPLALKVSPPPDRTDLRWIEHGWRRGDPPIVLPAAVSLRGIVVNEAGKPVPKAEVVVIDVDQRPHETRSDGEGRFVVHGLPVGPVEALATYGERPRLLSRRVRAPTGAGELRLVLSRGATLRVRIEGGVGAPADSVVDHEVELTSTDGAPADATADVGPDGVAVFEGLDPRASYALLISIEEPRRLVGLLRDVRGDAGEVVLRPEPTRTLVGVVRGAPPGSYVLVSISEHGLLIDEATRSDGVFALEDVPSGPFTIRAECDTPTGRLVGTARGSTAARVGIELAPAPSESR